MQVKGPKEHSAILSTFIKLPFFINSFVLPNFEWPLMTGFTVLVANPLSTAWMHRLITVLVACQCDMYQNLMHWLLQKELI